MTKVSIFKQEGFQKQSKPIEFVKYIGACGNMVDATLSPKKFDNVTLIISKSDSNYIYDTMYAWYNERPHGGNIYLGYWNDGVIE
jgi:hypothetical protein